MILKGQGNQTFKKKLCQRKTPLPMCSPYLFSISHCPFSRGASYLSDSGDGIGMCIHQSGVCNSVHQLTLQQIKGVKSPQLFRRFLEVLLFSYNALLTPFGAVPQQIMESQSVALSSCCHRCSSCLLPWSSLSLYIMDTPPLKSMKASDGRPAFMSAYEPHTLWETIKEVLKYFMS